MALLTSTEQAVEVLQHVILALNLVLWRRRSLNDHEANHRNRIDLFRLPCGIISSNTSCSTFSTTIRKHILGLRLEVPQILVDSWRGGLNSRKRHLTSIFETSNFNLKPSNPSCIKFYPICGLTSVAIISKPICP